jgi:hypothetical protein
MAALQPALTDTTTTRLMIARRMASMGLTGFPAASSSGPAPGSTAVTVTGSTVAVATMADAGSTADDRASVIAAADSAEDVKVVDSTDVKVADSGAALLTADSTAAAVDFTAAAVGSTVAADLTVVVDPTAADTAK